MSLFAEIGGLVGLLDWITRSVLALLPVMHGRIRPAAGQIRSRSLGEIGPLLVLHRSVIALLRRLVLMSCLWENRLHYSDAGK